MRHLLLYYFLLEHLIQFLIVCLSIASLRRTALQKDFEYALCFFKPSFQIVQKLRKEGQGVALRSQRDKLITGTNIYVVDTLGQ